MEKLRILAVDDNSISLARLPVPTLPHKALINHELTLFPRKILFSFMS